VLGLTQKHIHALYASKIQNIWLFNFGDDIGKYIINYSRVKPENDHVFCLTMPILYAIQYRPVVGKTAL